MNLALGARNPNPSELFSDGLHHSAARIELGSLTLNSEKSNRFSLSFLKENSSSKWQIDTYINTIQDYINQKEKKIVLIEDIVSLSEVNILASKDYLKLALKNFKKNTVSKTHQLNLLYRRFSSENNTSRFLVEHYIKILDMDPLAPEFYEIEVDEVRKSADYRFIKKKQKSLSFVFNITIFIYFLIYEVYI